MKRRRLKYSAHDRKRQLIGAMNRTDDRTVEDIVTELREYAVARRFHGSHRSIEGLMIDENLAAPWSRQRVEACIRKRTRLIGVRS